MLGRVPRGWVSPDMSGEVGLVSVRVRRYRLIGGKCSARSAYCLYVFGEV